MREQLFRLSSESGGSLQTQLREMVVRAILDGHIPPGSPLPSCRRLAKQLSVARNTVVLAYQHLVDDGYLVSRERSGYYVNEEILAGRVKAQPAQGNDAMFQPDWDKRLRTRASSQRNIEKPTDWQAYRYPFIYGQFDLALFPVADWRECSRKALSVGAIRRWAADSIDADDPNLIEQIHTRVLPRRGVWADPDEILITMGAQHALYLLSSVLLDRESVVGIEDPGYPDVRNIFELMSKQVIGLPVDEKGLILSAGLSQCDYVYVTPSHQYPTTVTMDITRRNELLRRSVDDDFIVIEDDYESEYNFVGEPTPALKSLDHSGRVIYVGSLSKTLAPGLRLGYMVAPAPLIREARALRRLMLRHPPANNQRAVALFLGLGHHESLVRRLSNALKERWQEVGDSLAQHLPDSSRVPTFGGTSYWVKGPASLDVGRLEAEAKADGILIERGDVNFMGPDPPMNCFRLGFSSITVDRIRPGIEKLAVLVNRCS
jgi:GntR family transcriptional regulator/MocR family aminotransferase